MSDRWGSLWNFLWPPLPSRIIAKLAFLPPFPSYSVVESTSDQSHFLQLKEEDLCTLSDSDVSRIKVYYATTKRNSRIVCIHIRHYSERIQPEDDVIREQVSTEVSDKKPFTVLFSHGNAVDLGQMLEFLHSIADHFRVNILSYDYSGYGASSGQPLEQNAYADADAAMTLLTKQLNVPRSRIVLYGQSIGTAPTVELAIKYKVAGVILHSPLMSAYRVVRDDVTRTPWFDGFANIDKANRILSPTLIIHGTNDAVIGIHHGRELQTKLRHPLEPLWVIGAGHNDIDNFPDYFSRLHCFFHEDLANNICDDTDDPETPEHLFVRRLLNFCSTSRSQVWEDNDDSNPIPTDGTSCETVMKTAVVEPTAPPLSSSDEALNTAELFQESNAVSEVNKKEHSTRTKVTSGDLVEHTTETDKNYTRLSDSS